MDIYVALYFKYCFILGIFSPLICSIFSISLSKMSKLRDFLMIFSSFVICCNFIIIAILFYMGIEIPSLSFKLFSNLNLVFKAQALGMIFALMASILWCITTIYTSGYIKITKNVNATQLYFFTSISIFFTIAIAFAANLFTIFIFYELLTISTYPLIAMEGSAAAKKASRQYLYTLLGCSILFLMPAIVGLSEIAGDIEFCQNGVLVGKISPVGIFVLLFCFVLGIAKTAIMPLHKWLPNAMIAPIPVSALLHSVAVVKAGIFFLIQVCIYIFGIDNLSSISFNFPWVNNWFLILSCMTIICSSVIAYRQTELKKILAYSTIGQLGYCLLAISLLTENSIISAIFQMISHGFAKITLFFVAGIIYASTGKTNINEMNGVIKSLPVSVLAFTVCAITIIGIPPFAIFQSKFFILNSVHFSEYSLLIYTTLIISTVLNAGYFIPIIYKFIWEKPQSPAIRIPIAMELATVASALGSVWISVYSDEIIEYIKLVKF